MEVPTPRQPENALILRALPRSPMSESSEYTGNTARVRRVAMDIGIRLAGGRPGEEVEFDGDGMAGTENATVRGDGSSDTSGATIPPPYGQLRY